MDNNKKTHLIMSSGESKAGAYCTIDYVTSSNMLLLSAVLVLFHDNMVILVTAKQTISRYMHMNDQ